MKYVVFSLLLLMFYHASAKIQVNLPLADNMVLQRNSVVVIAGKSSSSNVLFLKENWSDRVYKDILVDKNGNWTVKVTTTNAVGNFQIEITGNQENDKLLINNILLGEVWLCSGQSNMEMTMNGYLNAQIDSSQEEIAKANYPQIRSFDVNNRFSSEKSDSCNGFWMECSTKTAGNFSATAFFFAKKLHKQLNVPIGIINSTWGGTPVESWIDIDWISKVPSLARYADSLKSHVIIDNNRKTEAIGLNIRQKQWWKNTLGDKTEIFNESFTNTIKLPDIKKYIDPTDTNKIRWYKTSVNIPESWKGKDLVLKLAAIDDYDSTYFNNMPAGGTLEQYSWYFERVYRINKLNVKIGLNDISVCSFDLGNNGGFWRGWNNNFEMCIFPENEPNEKISLEKDWGYKDVAISNKVEKYPFQKSGVTCNSPGALYNSMIYPLKNLQIKGVIWYQGEANVGRADDYSKMFPIMIDGWRNLFNNQNLPFYYAQIAPYEINWSCFAAAELREAQRITEEKMNNAEMISTSDCGDLFNIHPSNKKLVGERLANKALNNVYGFRNIFCDFPTIDSVKKYNHKLVVTFKNVNGKLKFKNGLAMGFEIADDRMVFVPCDEVVITENKIILGNKNISNPTIIRYAWNNSVSGNLVDSSGTPAFPFRKKVD